MKLLPLLTLLTLVGSGLTCAAFAADDSTKEKRIEKSEIRIKTADGETRERRLIKEEKRERSSKPGDRSGHSERHRNPAHPHSGQSRSGSNRGPG